MTTLDARITKDLAALATDSRLQLVPLARTLRSLEHRDAVVDTRPANRLVVVASRVYAQRLARAVTSSVCLTGILWGVYQLIHPLGPARHAIGMLRRGNKIVFDGEGMMTFFLQPAFIALCAAIVAVASYVITLRIASHAYEWQLARAIERSKAADLEDTGKSFAGRVLGRSQRFGITVEVAVLASIIMMIGIAAFTIGAHGWTVFAYPPLGYDAREPVQAAGPLYMLLAITIACGGAIYAGQLATRPRRDYAARILAIGIVGVVATLIAGFSFDVGPLVIERAWEGDFMFTEPVSVPLRVVLVACGSLSITAIVAALSWRRRRTEVAAVTGDDRPLGHGDRVVISLAHMFERRVAHAAFGATCLVCVLAIVAINREFEGGFNAEYRFTEALLKQDPLLLIGIVTLLALCVQLAAKRYARRALERHVQQGSAIMDARRLVARADRWAMMFGLGGITVAIVVFGVYASATENNALLFLDRHWQRGWDHDDIVVIAGIAIALVLAMSAAIAGRLRRPVRHLAFLERPTSAFLGIALGIAAMAAGTYYRMHAASNEDVWASPDAVAYAIRIAFTLVGTTAVVMTVFGFALARRRRELDALAPDVTD